MKEIRNITIMGAGTIGASWAINFAWKGHEVTLYDVAEASLERAQGLFRKNLAVLVDNDIIPAEDVEPIIGRICCTTDVAAALKDADFIQECGPESYEAKFAIMETIETYASADCIIACSTSGLLIGEVGKYMKHPERLIGAHPYNPPHLLPLVEIVKGEKSAQENAQAAYDFYKSLGKEPVLVQKDVSGFIANRIQVAVFREMIDLVQNGVCSLEDADKAALYGPGLRWGLLGPMTVLHLGGGPGGIYDNMLKQRESYDLRLAEMADWKHFPENLAEIADAGMKEELAHRPESQGRTLAELEAWRDENLIKILRLHEKL